MELLLNVSRFYESVIILLAENQVKPSSNETAVRFFSLHWINCCCFCLRLRSSAVNPNKTFNFFFFFFLFVYFDIGYVSVGMWACPKNTEKGTWDIVNAIGSIRLWSVGWLGRCRRYNWRSKRSSIESTASCNDWKRSSQHQHRIRCDGNGFWHWNGTKANARRSYTRYSNHTIYWAKTGLAAK